MVCIVFFFNDPATTGIYTLSLHDALPILAVIRLPGAAAAGPLLPPEEPTEEVPDELHPTTSAAAAAAAGSASSIHGRRLRAFIVARDLVITFSFACWGPAPPSPPGGEGASP